MTTDTSKITGAADELSSGLSKGGSAAKTLGQEIANAIAALDGRVSALEAGGSVEPPIEPPIEPPVEPPAALTPSGSITVSGNNTVIENKEITGKIECVNWNGLTIRNCIVKHSGASAIFAQNCDGLTIEDVWTEYTANPGGQNPLPGEWFAVKLNNVRGAANLTRLTMIGTGIYAVISPANFKMSFIEGHDMRGPTSPLRGQLIQMNQCPNDIVIEDWSCENAKDNSRPEDVISIYQCGANKVKIRRGLADGCNSPSGVMVMIENGTTGALIEDVDVVRHGNGAFSFYDASNNGTFKNCRLKDQVIGNQGRGNPSSGASGQPCNLVAAPGVTGARFEALKYQNISSNHTWVTSGTVVQMTQENFTPRSPIRNPKPGAAAAT